MWYTAEFKGEARDLGHTVRAVAERRGVPTGHTPLVSGMSGKPAAGQEAPGRCRHQDTVPKDGLVRERALLGTPRGR